MTTTTQVIQAIIHTRERCHEVYPFQLQHILYNLYAINVRCECMITSHTRIDCGKCYAQTRDRITNTIERPGKYWNVVM